MLRRWRAKRRSTGCSEPQRNGDRQIWILNHYAGASGAPSTRHFDIGRELVRLGYRVTIFAAGFNYQKLAEERLANGENWKREDHDGVCFVWVRTFPYRRNDWRRAVNMASYALRVAWIGLRLAERPNAIVGSSVHPLAVVSAYFLSRVKRARFVFEVRDLWPQTLVEMGALRERGLITGALRALERTLYRRAFSIITLLPFANSYIQGLGVPSDKIVCIPNGADLSRYVGLDDYDGGPQAGPLTAMYAGAHGKANALDVILDAALILNESHPGLVHFSFVGDGPEKEHLVELAERRQLLHVSFGDPVPKDRIADVLRTADMFLFNLEDLALFAYGISSNKLFDYLASSRPIIFSANAANNPVRDAGAGLTVPPRSPERLARAILDLATMSPARRRQMGKNGRAYLERNHDIKRLARDFASALQVD